MQILNQDRNRNFNRVIIFSLIILAVIVISWGIASTRASTMGLDGDGGYSVDGASRISTSIDEQIQTLQGLVRDNPNDWQSYSQLALAYLQKARETGDPSYYQKVEEALSKTAGHQADDYATVSAMGSLALARHQFQSALELGERARQLDPDRTYAYGVIADAQIELGQYDAAVETLQTMVNLRPDMSSYSRISYIRELNGDNEGALEMMQSAVDAGVPNAENTAWTRTQLAHLYFNSGNLDQAELEYVRTLNDRPGYVYALAGLGRVRAAQGKPDEAIELLTEATNVMPLPEFVITLGDIYQVNGQLDAAQQQYNLVGAIEQLFKANGSDMDMEIALFNADQDKELAATVALARKAYANRPSIHAADVLAWALYKTGNYDEAMTYSEEALQLGTQDALKLFHAGMIAYRLGDNDQAQEYLQQAIEINPHFSILYSNEALQTLDLLKAQGAN
ncbi:MAG: tetratricopeptide repeat protein [Chloroflexota bacterium]|nr:tetratricopeptide repeat protein [Chloroflexota bacterium]